MSASQVCLNMIVRDEAPVIERCLQSVAALIGHWMVVDTGSGDGTQRIVQNFFDQRKIPGTLIERPWVDFATNRTEALDYARPHGSYVLIIDADDTIETELDFSWPELTEDAYALKILDLTISYERTQLVRSSLPWSYRGVLHEFLTCDGARPSSRMDGIVMHRNHDGARRLNPNTYKNDAALQIPNLPQPRPSSLRS